MRSLQRSFLARAVVAVLISGALTLFAWRTGAAAMVGLLLTTLFILTFILLIAAPDFIAYQLQYPWRW